MNIKFSILTFFIAACCMCFAYTVSAQEEGSSLNEFQDLNQNSELHLEEDKTLIFEGDYKPSKKEVEVATPNKPALKTKSSDGVKPGNKDEEDALSFNFLYYIIQKFKYPDLLDQ